MLLLPLILLLNDERLRDTSRVKLRECKNKEEFIKALWEEATRREPIIRLSIDEARWRTESDPVPLFRLEARAAFRPEARAGYSEPSLLVYIDVLQSRSEEVGGPFAEGQGA